MSPGEVLDKHTSRELTEWAAFLSLYPQGEWRADLRNGIVCSTVANAMRNKKQKAYKPEDFMPKFGVERQQSEEEIKLKAEAFAKAFGGKMGKLGEGG